MFSSRQCPGYKKSRENRSAYSAPNKNKTVRQHVNPHPSIPAPSNSISLSVRDIPQLQATIGNQAVMQLLSQNQKADNYYRPESPSPEKEQEQRPNCTGIPDKLKSGLEAMSGLDLSDVRVHRNSDKPLQVDALAYSQGSNIYIGPGQEKHLAHEGWHVVQQKQGRVQTTGRIGGEPLNDESRLENEAGLMGEKAWQSGNGTGPDRQNNKDNFSGNPSGPPASAPLQRVIVAPNKADPNTIIGIYQMLLNQKDQKVTRYKMLKNKQVDLSKESQILFKGHGYQSGEYHAAGKSYPSQNADEIAQVLAGVGGQNANLIGLDYCHSGKIGKDLKTKMATQGFKGTVRGNKFKSVTQQSGENFSKDPTKINQLKQLQYNQIVGKLKTTYSQENTDAEGLAGDLKKALKGKTDSQEITELYFHFGKQIYEKLKPVYDELYQYNEDVIDPNGKETF